MLIQRLFVLAGAMLVCGVHAQGEISYGFGPEERATQNAGLVAPSTVAAVASDLVRTSYVAPSTPAATAVVAPTASAPPAAAGSPMILTPSSGGLVSASPPMPTPASTKTGCPSICTAIFKPVCGSDGRTYSNSCALSVAQCKSPGAKITLAAEGECGENSSTPVTPTTPATTTPAPPVTTTPDSPTSTTSAPAQTPAVSTPSAPKCAQMCTADFKPLCGSDGKTYSNACELSIAQCESPQSKIAKVSEGECGSSANTGGTQTPASANPASSPSPSPVDTGGVATTPLPAPVPAVTAPAATKPAATKPTPPSESKCEMACTKKYAPVCGSNGKTYSNACLLHLANCKTGAAAKVGIKHQGSCAVTTAKPTEVTDSNAATSGSSMVTAAPGGKGTNLRGSGAGGNSPVQSQ